MKMCCPITPLQDGVEWVYLGPDRMNLHTGTNVAHLMNDGTDRMITFLEQATVQYEPGEDHLGDTSGNFEASAAELSEVNELGQRGDGEGSTGQTSASESDSDVETSTGDARSSGTDSETASGSVLATAYDSVQFPEGFQIPPGVINTAPFRIAPQMQMQQYHPGNIFQHGIRPENFPPVHYIAVRYPGPFLGHPPATQFLPQGFIQQPQPFSANPVQLGPGSITYPAEIMAPQNHQQVYSAQNNFLSSNVVQCSGPCCQPQQQLYPVPVAVDHSVQTFEQPQPTFLASLPPQSYESQETNSYWSHNSDETYSLEPVLSPQSQSAQQQFFYDGSISIPGSPTSSTSFSFSGATTTSTSSSDYDTTGIDGSSESEDRNTATTLSSGNPTYINQPFHSSRSRKIGRGKGHKTYHHNPIRVGSGSGTNSLMYLTDCGTTFYLDGEELPFVVNTWDPNVPQKMSRPPSNLEYYVPPMMNDKDFFGGQVHMWQIKIMQHFGKYRPDVWRMQAVPNFQKPATEGWLSFSITSKLRYCCRVCKVPWTSKQGKIIFAFYLDSQTRQGCIFLKMFGQVCMRKQCRDWSFQVPACYPEEIDRATHKLSEFIGYVHYGVPLSPFIFAECQKSIRIGTTSNQKPHHRKEYCQACRQGLCQVKLGDR